MGVAEAGPVEGRAVVFISHVDVLEVVLVILPEEDQRKRLISLSCHMQHVLAVPIGQGRISPRVDQDID